MNVIILCGGLSTRLGEVTKDIPKILLEIGGRTVFDWQLELVKSLGVSDIVLAAGHLSHVLQEVVGNERHGVEIIHAVEPTRLGTGGAIKFAWQYVRRPSEPVLVLNGDILTTISLPHMVAKLDSASDGIILGAQVPDAATYGTLQFDAACHLQSFKEKEGLHIPGYINGGMYLFTPKAKQYFPSQDVFSIEYDVFPRMERLYVYPSQDAWIDIGVPERLDWARTHWQEFIRS